MKGKQYLSINTPDEFNGYREKVAAILESAPRQYGLIDRWDIIAINQPLLGGIDVYLRGYTKGIAEFIRLTVEIDELTGEWSVRSIARPKWRQV